MLYLKCKGQVVSIDVDERLADQYINANTVHWEFCERWADMVITAQFTQNGKTYNVLVDEVTNTTTMPNEIEAGDVDISAFGEHPLTGVRITTIPVKKKVDKSGFVGDGETPIPPTPDLYAQLLAKINEVGEIPVEDIQNAVNDYLSEHPVQAGATEEQAAQIEANKQAIEENSKDIAEYVPPVTSVNGMTGDVIISAGGGTADSVAWDKVTGKPETFPPSDHEHSYADLKDKPTIPVVPSFLPNPYALTINGKNYNGSEAVVVSVAGIDDNTSSPSQTYSSEKIDAELTQLKEKNDEQDRRLTVVEQNGGEGVRFETDNTLTLKDGILSVNTTDVVEEDNTLPVTSAAVYVEVGNINALLATI